MLQDGSLGQLKDDPVSGKAKRLSEGLYCCLCASDPVYPVLLQSFLGWLLLFPRSLQSSNASAHRPMIIGRVCSCGSSCGWKQCNIFLLLTAAPSSPVTSPWPSPSLQPSSSSSSSAACCRPASGTQGSCPEPPPARLQTWKSGSVRLLSPLWGLVQCVPVCACVFWVQRGSSQS